MLGSVYDDLREFQETDSLVLCNQHFFQHFLYFQGPRAILVLQSLLNSVWIVWKVSDASMQSLQLLVADRHSIIWTPGDGWWFIVERYECAWWVQHWCFVQVFRMWIGIFCYVQCLSIRDTHGNGAWKGTERLEKERQYPNSESSGAFLPSIAFASLSLTNTSLKATELAILHHVCVGAKLWHGVTWAKKYF